MSGKSKIPPDYKKTEIGIIPEDWEVKNMEEVSTLKARIGWQGLTTSEYLKHGDYFLITGTDFESGKIKWEKSVYVSKRRYDQDKNIQIEKNDILITKDGTIGKVAFIYDNPPKPATLNSGIFVIRPKNGAYDPLFVFYLFNSSFFRIFLNKLMAGSTINHLYQKDFINFLIPLPPTIAEQCTIARVLSDIDRLIESLDKLIEKKKLIKKGTMQELLTGKKRLPGFTGEWVRKKLVEVGFCKSGSGFPLKYQNVKQGNYPFFKVSDMARKENLIFLKRPNNWISEDIREKIKATTFPKHSIIFAKIGAAVFLERKKILLQESCIDNNMMGFIVNNSKADYMFMYYLFNSISLSELVELTALPSISKDNIENIEFAIPPTLAEQQAIAQILSDMDAEIEALERKKQKYEMMKKAAMELLLTGKVRLKFNNKK